MNNTWYSFLIIFIVRIILSANPESIKTSLRLRIILQKFCLNDGNDFSISFAIFSKLTIYNLFVSLYLKKPSKMSPNGLDVKEIRKRRIWTKSFTSRYLPLGYSSKKTSLVSPLIRRLNISLLSI